MNEDFPETRTLHLTNEKLTSNPFNQAPSDPFQFNYYLYHWLTNIITPIIGELEVAVPVRSANHTAYIGNAMSVYIVQPAPYYTNWIWHTADKTVCDFPNYTVTGHARDSNFIII